MEEINFLPILMGLIVFATINLFLYFNFDLLQPAISFFIVMTFSLVLGVINIERWNLFVGPDTSLIVIGGMFAFAGGAIFVHYCFYCSNNKSNIRRGKIKWGIYSVPFWLALLCTAITLSLAYFSGKEMYELSLQLGNQDGVMNMIRTIRYPLERGELQFSRSIIYRNLISMSIAASFLFLFFNNIISRNKIVFSDCWLLLPVIAEFPFFIMSTGRRSIVEFIIFGLILGGILFQQKFGISHKVRIKILKLIGFTGILSLALYFGLGFLTGKVSYGGRSPWTIISHYGGLSVPALEQYVSSVHVENQYILQNTMMGIYGNLNSLGFHLEPGSPFLPFVEFQGIDHIDTNVYTVFYRLLADYSLIGMLLIMFIFGIFLTYLYDYLKHYDSPCLLTIYSFFGYIPFFLFIDDQFMGLFRSRTVYFCLLIIIFLNIARRYYFTELTEKDIGKPGNSRAIKQSAN